MSSTTSSRKRRAHELGVRQVWLAQQFDHDAIALAGLVGAAVPGLGVGTSVVPINPRHPLIVASLAQTAQAAAHGNFSLGLGLGAHEPERLAFGSLWPNTIGRLREHLQVLRSIFDTGAVDFHGNEITASPEWAVRVAGGTPIPVYVAAMGPKALQVTGELADGTFPLLAGPRTIGEFIEPTIARRPPTRDGRSHPVVSEGDRAGRRRERGRARRHRFFAVGHASAARLPGRGRDGRGAQRAGPHERGTGRGDLGRRRLALTGVSTG